MLQVGPKTKIQADGGEHMYMCLHACSGESTKDPTHTKQNTKKPHTCMTGMNAHAAGVQGRLGERVKGEGLEKGEKKNPVPSWT